MNASNTTMSWVRSSTYSTNENYSQKYYIGTAADVSFIVLVAIMAIFGVTANIITFLVIQTSTKLRKSSFNVLLMSLCVSDFVSALISPVSYFKLSFRAQDTTLTTFLCKMVWGIDHWTSVATIQHILAFVVMRLVGLKYPHKMKEFTPRMAAYLATFIWLVTGAVSGVYPMLVMDVYYDNRRGVACRVCDLSSDWSTFAINYAYYGGTLLLMLPSILVVTLSIYLTAKMKKRLENRKTNGKGNSADARKEKRAMVQLILVIGSFVFGYGPEIFFRIAKTSTLILKWENHTLFNDLAICRFLFLRISECINPLLYNIASSNMRTATIKFLSRFGFKFCKENLRPAHTGQQMLLGNVNNPQPLPNLANETREHYTMGNVNHSGKG